MSNSPEFLICYFACQYLGAVAVTTNTRSSVSEIEYFATKSKAKVAVADQKTAADVLLADADLAWLVAVRCDSEILGNQRCRDFTVLLQYSPLDKSEAIDPLDPAAIQFTSGTTAKPKGVVFTHANVLWAGRIGASHLTLNDSDKTLVIAPLYHVNAMHYSAMATLWSGGTVILVPKFSKSGFWKTINDYEITWLSIQPFAIRVLATEKSPEHSLRLMGLGAADLSEIELAMGTPTLGWWGMTETVTHPIHTVAGWPSRRMSMGRPSPEYEVKVVAADGTEVRPSPEGTRGRLLVRGIVGLSMFWEYLDDAEATAKDFTEDGWFDTGDQVVVYDDGEILFGDREKDMIRVGGENVAASEIERVIASVDGVNEVAVVARSHALLDEVPYAFVIAHDRTDLEARIIERCEQELADFKVPFAVEILNQFPRSELDKVAKGQLRVIAAKAELPAKT